ncbi:hypothetical protein PV328_006784 [Microctonus aethiopoides]|uniref:Uncharacterized protein n=1 Tax=Microctonus aethiopoides TaxID=144406 RepID=A0AA39FQQ0_9HYME|nr:hypothetical protein PV328_006784 [Microctonus aethiopoides]
MIICEYFECLEKSTGPRMKRKETKIETFFPSYYGISHHTKKKYKPIHITLSHYILFEYFSVGSPERWNASKKNKRNTFLNNSSRAVILMIKIKIHTQNNYHISYNFSQANSR